MTYLSESEIKKLIGYKFPGGTYTIAHWENYLLTDCTGSKPLPNNLAHPVALFHATIMGADTSIDQMFELGQAESPFSISIESYDWELFAPLFEEMEYTVDGVITDVSRITDKEKVEKKQFHGECYDRIQFQFTLTDPQQLLVARVTVTWHYNRGVDAS